MKNQLRKAEMIFAVNEVLVKNDELFSSVFQLKNLSEKFNSNAEKIRLFLSIFEKDISHQLNDCNLLKEKLENLLIPVTGTLLVYAHDHNNKPYVEKLKKLRKKSEKTTPEELLERSKSLIIKLKKQFNNQATDEKEKPEFKEDHISAYGITSEMVEELAETRRKYRKTWSLISELLYTKKKSKKKVISLVKQNENLLKNKIDLILTIYEKREPAFYNAYQNARIIETVVPVENDAKNANLTTSV